MESAKGVLEDLASRRRGGGERARFHAEGGCGLVDAAGAIRGRRDGKRGRVRAVVGVRVRCRRVGVGSRDGARDGTNGGDRGSAARSGRALGGRRHGGRRRAARRRRIRARVAAAAVAPVGRPLPRDRRRRAVCAGRLVRAGSRSTSSRPHSRGERHDGARPGGVRAGARGERERPRGGNRRRRRARPGRRLVLRP